ncbi:hypothetical protein LAZ27_22460 [Escherichia coli]|nr:hypothetical protein [Escherichia coli]MDD9111109.1 hypothetical protein [Escherichia coli]BEC07664.1 hypothetical protein VEE25_42160 [Escherichia coli]
MARSCVTDPRWRELVALYRYDWIAAADVLFGKTPTWQQDLIIESVQEQGSKTSVSSGHGTGKSDMTSTGRYCQLLHDHQTTLPEKGQERCSPHSVV